MTRSAMQQALEALMRTDTEPGTLAWGREVEAVLALRAALAEQAQPVAGVVFTKEGRAALVEYGHEGWHCANRGAQRLYTTPPAPVAPPGWRMVPVEPTQEMREAAASFGGRGGYNAQRGDEAVVAWQDMLATAPEAPTPPAPQPLTELPPLPEPNVRKGDDLPSNGGFWADLYDADQMRAYARAVEAEAEVLKRMGVQR